MPKSCHHPEAFQKAVALLKNKALKDRHLNLHLHAYLGERWASCHSSFAAHQHREMVSARISHRSTEQCKPALAGTCHADSCHQDFGQLGGPQRGNWGSFSTRRAPGVSAAAERSP